MSRFAGTFGLSRSGTIPRSFPGRFVLEEIHPQGGSAPCVGFMIRVSGIGEYYRGAVEAVDLSAELGWPSAIIRCRTSYGILHPRPSRDMRVAINGALHSWLNQQGCICGAEMPTMRVEVREFLIRLPGPKAANFRGWRKALKAILAPAEVEKVIAVERQFREQQERREELMN